MKKRILFWIDEGLVEFGIAKFLQDKNEFDLYCIYDIKYPLSESFKNQKIIQFKKEWFFWEYISKHNKNIDINYLKSLEERYKIRFWAMVYSERIFYKFNPFHKFERKEIISIIEQESKFFEQVLDETNPGFLIIKVTDFHRNHLLYEMCKKRNIKVLSLIPTRIGNKATISSELNKFDETWNLDDHILNEGGFDLGNYLKKHDRVKQTQKIISGGINLPFNKKIKAMINWIRIFDQKYKSSYDRSGITRLKAARVFFLSVVKAKIRKFFIDKNFIREISDEKIIFFPLQVEPERNVSIDAPYYSDQINVIINIAKSLPVGYRLYVKEHFSMKFRNWRKISDYKKIMSLPNVRLVHPSVNPKYLIEKSSLVITISSTAGLEAAYYNKPSIVFADTIYSSISSVYRVKGFENLQNTIKTALQARVDSKSLNNLIRILDRNSFEFDAFGIGGLILKRFHGEGFMINSRIPMKELDEFFVENEKIFKKLCDEYLKVIKKLEVRR